MTAVEAFELTTKGGSTDFGRVIEIAERCGPYCLIGGLAVNCYVEAVYTLDADFAIASSDFSQLQSELDAGGFAVHSHAHTLNAQTAMSQLRIQFATDPRYRDFPFRSVTGEVLGVTARIACLDDVVQGKLWAYTDPARRFSKRKKDELDLIRLAEAYPHIIDRYPPALRDQLDAQV